MFRLDEVWYGVVLSGYVMYGGVRLLCSCLGEFWWCLVRSGLVVCGLVGSLCS